MQGPRTVFFTGIDGFAKKKRIREIIDCASFLYPSAKIYPYSVGDEMQKEYTKTVRTKGHSISKAELLDLPEAEQKSLREKALRSINKDFEGKAKSSWDVAFILTRATYFHRGEFCSTLDESHHLLHPLFCVNLIDDIQIMHRNMQKDTRWKAMVLQRLLDWRENELKRTKEKYNPTCVLAVRESPQTLLDLLFTEKKKAYLSFPITHASPEIKEKKGRFIKRLREHFIVFDPFSIQEYDNALKEYGSSDDFTRELGLKTVSRDYDLIERCDCVIVYYPTTKIYVEDLAGEKTLELENGQKIKVKETEGVFLSAGVVSEMEFTDRNPHIKLYAVWESDKIPSPFFSKNCDHIYNSEELFFNDISNF